MPNRITDTWSTLASTLTRPEGTAANVAERTLARCPHGAARGYPDRLGGARHNGDRVAGRMAARLA